MDTPATAREAAYMPADHGDITYRRCARCLTLWPFGRTRVYPYSPCCGKTLLDRAANAAR